jgi:hypothetical protein
MSPNRRERRARRALSSSLHNQRFPRVHQEDNLLDSRRAHAIEHSRDDPIPGPGVGSNLDFSFRSMAYTFADRDRKPVEINLTTTQVSASARDCDLKSVPAHRSLHRNRRHA